MPPPSTTTAPERVPVEASGGGADTNDVVLAVPADKTWKLQLVYAELTTTATAGNRQLRLQVRDAADAVLFETTAAAVVAASKTGVSFSWARGLPRADEIADDVQTGPLPEAVIDSAYDVRVFDSAEIDTLDDLIVRVVSAERVA